MSGPVTNSVEALPPDQREVLYAEIGRKLLPAMETFGTSLIEVSKSAAWVAVHKDSHALHVKSEVVVAIHNDLADTFNTAITGARQAAAARAVSVPLPFHGRPEVEPRPEVA